MGDDKGKNRADKGTETVTEPVDKRVPFSFNFNAGVKFRDEMTRQDLVDVVYHLMDELHFFKRCAKEERAEHTATLMQLSRTVRPS